MNRWAIKVSLLYAAIIGVLVLPVSRAAFGKARLIRLSDLLEMLAAWQFWLLLAALFVSQFALLRTPVDVARRRPERRGSLWPAVVAGGLMAGLLMTGVVVTVLEGVRIPLESIFSPIVLLPGIASWIAWAFLFHRMGKADPKCMVKRQSNWLIKGSVLELLVAVPMHVLVRNRGECCAGLFTFFGIATGIGVMLFAFGPAVFFLFVERWRRLQPTKGAGEQ